MHMHRAKYVPNGGPDGGDGGRGGHVYLRGNHNYWTLLHLRFERHVFAGHGGNGGPSGSTGADGEDRYIDVPCGTVVYDADAVKKRVDFCGTNIESGASVGRLACNDWIRERPDYKLAVVLDDDYGGVVSDYTTTPTLNNKTFYEIVKSVYKLGKDLNIITGGYSGGAHPNTKKNKEFCVRRKSLYRISASRASIPWNPTDLLLIFPFL